MSNANELFVALVCLACSPPPEFPPRIPPIARAELQSAPSDGGCVRYWAETRYRSYAYDHIVHLSSSCYRVASCVVETNVTPKPVIVAVGPGEHVEVVTARGSELPEFTPEVQCSSGTR